MLILTLENPPKAGWKQQRAGRKHFDTGPSTHRHCLAKVLSSSGKSQDPRELSLSDYVGWLLLNMREKGRIIEHALTEVTVAMGCRQTPTRYSITPC